MPVHFLHHQLSQKVPLCKVHERGGHSADGQVELICYRTGQPSVADIKMGLTFTTDKFSIILAGELFLLRQVTVSTSAL